MVAEGDKRFVLLLQGTNDDDSGELFFSGEKDEAAEMQKNHCCCRRSTEPESPLEMATSDEEGNVLDAGPEHSSPKKTN